MNALKCSYVTEAVLTSERVGLTEGQLSVVLKRIMNTFYRRQSINAANYTVYTVCTDR